MRVECVHCGSPNARYVRTETDLILRCMCGVEKVVFSVLAKMQIEHNDAGPDVKVPKQNTHLYNTMMAVDVLVEATTKEITDRLLDAGEGYSVSDVASYLTILRAKGLVATTVIRRGVLGGSTWVLTDIAQDLLGF